MLRRPRRPAGRLARRRDVRIGAAVLATVLAAGTVVPMLRAGVDDPAGPPRGGPTPAPGPARVPLPVVPEPSPPYDRLPGRTPIPVPQRSGWALAGTLPPLGPAGKATATRAAELVLGRYCFQPDRYTLAVSTGDRGWRQVAVAVFLIERGGAGPALPLRLSWTGRGYAWVGPGSLAAGC